MKRSNMLAKIREYLQYSHDAKYDIESVACGLIILVEVNGMLPPLRDKMVDDKFVGYSNMQVPEWDEEDL